MDGPRSNWRESLERGLVCPKERGGCTAMNRPGATVIEVQQGCTHAYCGVCSFVGPIDIFQPHKEQ